ncbi:hypothetical protein RRF57_010107 [Xylaria bambusicola]|uniref:Uncharacterized protein n=1 Tax=Xylaria bambusicola TaxID=326684 RepID=A0AAN7V0H7_9PEZI
MPRYTRAARPPYILLFDATPSFPRVEVNDFGPDLLLDAALRIFKLRLLVLLDFLFLFVVAPDVFSVIASQYFDSHGDDRRRPRNHDSLKN